MRLRAACPVLAAILTAEVTHVHPVCAQTIQIRAEAVGMTYQEAREGGDGLGKGIGGGLTFRFKRFRLDASGYRAHVSSEGGGDFDLSQVDVRLGYFVTQFLALEAGGGRRYVTPEFATQEVGMVRVGAYAANHLNRLASVWLRGAYLVDPRFSGGGASDLAFEFGLGVAVGTTNGRFKFLADYQFERIDRSISTSRVPIQTSIARTGFAFGF